MGSLAIHHHPVVFQPVFNQWGWVLIQADFQLSFQGNFLETSWFSEAVFSLAALPSCSFGSTKTCQTCQTCHLFGSKDCWGWLHSSLFISIRLPLFEERKSSWTAPFSHWTVARRGLEKGGCLLLWARLWSLSPASQTCPGAEFYVKGAVLKSTNDTGWDAHPCSVNLKVK